MWQFSPVRPADAGSSDSLLVHEHFHYRNIDVSTVKELCRRFSPEIYEKKGEGRVSQHRVGPDLEDTIIEFEYYRDAFFWATV